MGAPGSVKAVAFPGPPHRPVLRGRVLQTFALAFLSAFATGAQDQATPAKTSLLLADAIRTEALPLIGSANYLGLGAEALKLEAWVRDHPSPLTLRPKDRSLEDGAGGLTKVSAPMALALTRLNQWYGLVASSVNPITHEQLKTAALSKASVGRIRHVFEAAIRRGGRVSGRWLTPETGGEATIDSELRLVEAPDPRWSTVQDLIGAAGDPEKVASLYETRPVEVAAVDTHSLLKLAVARFRLGTHGAPDEVRRAIATVALNSAPTYSHGPEEQFALIASRAWRGRYVGRWHTHAPHDADGGWAGAEVPSFEDMENAVRDGQYLTLAFQPDGFDLYDAEPLADAGRVDLALLRVIRYRSPSWRDYFKKLHPGAGRPG